MRVVGGKAKGTKLQAVPGDSTRPILDRVKTSLFDIIRTELPETNWLDLFAGTGGVGIEALSQGAASCVFLDLSKVAVQVIKDNVAKTHLEDQSEVRCIDAFRYLRNSSKQFDFIYVAPPQYKNLWMQAMQSIAERMNLLTDAGQVIVQIDVSEYEELQLVSLKEVETRRYGRTILVFYRAT